MGQALKPLVDIMLDLKEQLRPHKMTTRFRPKLNWKIPRNKRRYCRFGDECRRQNEDNGPDCYWRHGGHLKNSVPSPQHLK